MISFEDRFRSRYPDYRIEEEVVSDNLTRYHLFVGDLHCCDSGVREFAFKYALEDVKSGKLIIPPQIRQLQLWPAL